MLANYLVLLNNRLADARNFPELKDIVRNEASFFWKKSAKTYQQELIRKLPMPSLSIIELRKI